jgi:hypothetical protein
MTEPVRTIYMIEVQSREDPDHWTPMYQPCYSLEEAKAKLNRNPKAERSRYRVAAYSRTEGVTAGQIWREEIK